MFADFRASEKESEKELGKRIEEKTMRFGIGQPEIDAVADCIRKGELARFQVGANGRIARCEKELAAIAEQYPVFYPQVKKRYDRICAGERDLYF